MKERKQRGERMGRWRGERVCVRERARERVSRSVGSMILSRDFKYTAEYAERITIACNGVLVMWLYSSWWGERECWCADWWWDREIVRKSTNTFHPKRPSHVFIAYNLYFLSSLFPSSPSARWMFHAGRERASKRREEKRREREERKRERKKEKMTQLQQHVLTNHTTAWMIRSMLCMNSMTHWIFTLYFLHSPLSLSLSLLSHRGRDRETREWVSESDQ